MAVSRRVVVAASQPPTSVVTSVGQTTGPTVTLLAANVDRKGAFIFNNISTGFLFIKLGSGASSSDFSVKLFPGSVFWLPFPVYTGLITGVWSSAGAGTAQITEMS